MKKLSKITVVLAAIAMILGTSVISCAQGDETGENKSSTGTEENTGSSEETQAFSLANTHWFYETTSMRYDAITMNETRIHKGFGYISFEDATSGKSYTSDKDALYAAYKEFEETKTSGTKAIPFLQTEYIEFTYTVNGSALTLYGKIKKEDGTEEVRKIEGILSEDKSSFSSVDENGFFYDTFKKLDTVPKNATLTVIFTAKLDDNSDSKEDISVETTPLPDTYWICDDEFVSWIGGDSDDVSTITDIGVIKKSGYIHIEDARNGKFYSFDEDSFNAARKEFEETKTSGIKDIPYSQIPHYEFTYTINGTELIFYIKVTGEDGAEKIVKVKGYMPEDKIAFSQDVIYGNESIGKSFKKLKAAPKNAKLEVTFLQ